MYDIKHTNYGLRIVVLGKLSGSHFTALEQELRQKFTQYRASQKQFSLLIDARRAKGDRGLADKLKSLLLSAQQHGMSQLALVIPKMPMFVLQRLTVLLSQAGISRKQVFWDRTLAEDNLSG